VNVTQVIVGHDNKEAGRGWLLHSVCVRVANGDSAGSYWMFPCDRYADLQSFFITVSCICMTLWRFMRLLFIVCDLFYCYLYFPFSFDISLQ